jgi:hypothetical protein
MLLVRDIFYCKPGKVRPLVEKMVAMKKLSEKSGLGSMRVMTDVSAERFWTIVADFEVESMEAFMNMDKNMDPADLKEMEALMGGYHDFVDYGRREIYNLEG